MGNIKYEFRLNSKSYDKIKKGRYTLEEIDKQLNESMFSNETQTVNITLPIEKNGQKLKWGNPSLYHGFEVEDSSFVASSFNGFTLLWDFESLGEIEWFIRRIDMRLNCRCRRSIKKNIEQELKRIFPESKRPLGLNALINSIKNTISLWRTPKSKDILKRGWVSKDVYKVQKKSNFQKYLRVAN